MSGIYMRKTEGMVAKMAKRIVFWGDSITDAGRDRSAETDKSGYNRYLGCGYAQLIQAALGYDFPDEYEVLNRGISGNRIVDLYARIKADLINLKPDVISILIGINDVWHEYAHQNGVDAEKFELVYDWIIQEIRESLPNAKILILEPFVLPGSATVSTEEAPIAGNSFPQKPGYGRSLPRKLQRNTIWCTSRFRKNLTVWMPKQRL